MILKSKIQEFQTPSQLLSIFRMQQVVEIQCRFQYSFFKKIIYLFIYFWLCWVFISVQELSLVAASGGHSSSRCAGLSLSRPFSCCGAQAPDAQA